MPILEASTHLCRQAIASMNGLDYNQPLHVYLDESEIVQWNVQQGRSSFALLPFRRSSTHSAASSSSWGGSLFSSDSDKDQPSGATTGPANWSVNMVHALDGQATSTQKIDPEAVTPFESDLFTGSFFMANRSDPVLDEETRRAFFDGKARMCQCQWQVRLKRPQQGRLFLAWETFDKSHRHVLPNSTIQTALVRFLYFMNGKQNLFIRLPGEGADDDPWTVAVTASRGLSNFIQTPAGEELPDITKPFHGEDTWGSYFEMGYTYSFSFYIQYVDFTELALVNLPMIGLFKLPMTKLNMALYEIDDHAQGGEDTHQREAKTYGFCCQFMTGGPEIDADTDTGKAAAARGASSTSSTVPSTSTSRHVEAAAHAGVEP